MLSLLTNLMGNGIQLQCSFWAPRCPQSSVPVQQCQCDPWVYVDLVWWKFFSQAPKKISCTGIPCSRARRAAETLPGVTKSATCKPSLKPLCPCFGVIHIEPRLLSAPCQLGLTWGAAFISSPARPSVGSQSCCGGKNGRRSHFPGFVGQFLSKSFFGECPWQKNTTQKAPYIR